MKKNFQKIMLSCFAGVALIVCSAMPVRAMGPGSDCQHEYFALSLDGPTGEYEYLESGHYQVWGVGHTCLRCDYTFYTDIHLEWDSDHELGGATIVILDNGTTEVRYYCEFKGCDWYGVYE